MTKPRILVALLVLVAIAPLTRSNPPWRFEGQEWAAANAETTYVGAPRLFIEAAIDLESIRLLGLKSTISTDASAITIVTGRERIRLEWPSRGEIELLELGSAMDAFGVRVAGREVMPARAPWLRTVRGTEPLARVQFEGATYIIVGHGVDEGPPPSPRAPGATPPTPRDEPDWTAVHEVVLAAAARLVLPSAPADRHAKDTATGIVVTDDGWCLLVVPPGENQITQGSLGDATCRVADARWVVGTGVGALRLAREGDPAFERIGISPNAPTPGAEAWLMPIPDSRSQGEPGVAGAILEIKDDARLELSPPDAPWFGVDIPIAPNVRDGIILDADARLLGIIHPEASHTLGRVVAIEAGWMCERLGVPLAEDDEPRRPAPSPAPEPIGAARYVHGIPVLPIVRDVPATRVFESAATLEGGFRCATCTGRTTVEERRVVGHETLPGGLRRPIHRNYTVPCGACSATGYRLNRGIERNMDNFVERLARVDRAHPRYDTGRDDLWPARLRAVLDVNPARASAINPPGYRRLRDAQRTPIGSPIWFVGTLDFERPVWLRERETAEFRAVYFAQASMYVLVSQPQIEHALGGRYCLVGGLLAGFAFPDDEGVPLVPVLQDGFIIGR
ncbi:MAG: hypothetical protein R3B68_08825 [Phycisphaerales bacterium]